MIILVVLNVDFAVHRVMNWMIRPGRGEGRGGAEGAAGRRTEGSWEGTILEEVVLEEEEEEGRWGGASSSRVYTTGNEEGAGVGGERARGGESWGGVSTWGITVLGSLWSWEGQGLGRVRAWRG